MQWSSYWQSHSPKRRAIEFLRRAYFAPIFTELINNFAGRPSRILEAGCGSGTYLNVLSKYGHITAGIDNEPNAVRIARKNCGDVRLADIKKLPFRKNSFDLIFNQGVMEHFSDAEFTAILRECARVAPKAAIIVPAATSPFRLYDLIGDDPDKRFFTKSEIRRLLQTAFSQVKADYLPQTGFLSLIGYGENPIKPLKP